jgi:hypothetical protein
LRAAAGSLAGARGDEIPQDDLQLLLSEAVRAYHRKRAAGEDFGPFPAAGSVSATEVAVAAANMLQAVDLDLFELGMWMRQGQP